MVADERAALGLEPPVARRPARSARGTASAAGPGRSCRRPDRGVDRVVLHVAAPGPAAAAAARAPSSVGRVRTASTTCRRTCRGPRSAGTSRHVGGVVRYDRTSRLSGWLRLFCRAAPALTAPPPWPPMPCPLPLPGRVQQAAAQRGQHGRRDQRDAQRHRPDPAPGADRRGRAVPPDAEAGPPAQPAARRRAAEDPAPAREPVPALGEQQQQIAGRGQQEAQPPRAAVGEPGGDRVQRQQRQPGGGRAVVRHGEGVHGERDQQHAADQQEPDARGDRRRDREVADVVHAVLHEPRRAAGRRPAPAGSRRAPGAARTSRSARPARPGPAPAPSAAWPAGPAGPPRPPPDCRQTSSTAWRNQPAGVGQRQQRAGGHQRGRRRAHRQPCPSAHRSRPRSPAPAGTAPPPRRASFNR